MASSLAQIDLAIDPNQTYASAKAQRVLFDPAELVAKQLKRAAEAPSRRQPTLRPPADPRTLHPALAELSPHGPANPLQDTPPLSVRARSTLEDLVKCSRVPTVLQWLDSRSNHGPTGAQLNAW
ncbi:MAG: hypothetical protein AAF560_22865 [Acidobacteriota bacterium]